MRNSLPPFARLASVLMFGFLVGACSSETPPLDDRPITGGGGTGSSGTPDGTGNNTSSGGNTDLVVDEKPPELPATPGCGDGNLTTDEACDDGNKTSGDGCASNCLIVERGFSCASPGKACREIARCGDGIVAASEPCDDGNVVPGDGCSERCRIEIGKKCSGMPSVCTDAKCGNGVVEGAESCDDGNNAPFDGCSALCLREPNCKGSILHVRVR